MDLITWINSSEELMEVYSLTEIDENLFKKIRLVKKQFWIRVITSKECHYCVIHIPHLWKIFEHFNCKIDVVLWDSLSEGEQENLVERYTLTALPTVIFYNSEDQELDRFVQKPRNEKLEIDIFQILNTN